MIIPIPIFGDVAWHSVAMLGAYAVPLAGEMSRKPTSGGDETEGWQSGLAVGKALAGHRRSQCADRIRLRITALLRRENMKRAGRKATTVAEQWQDFEGHPPLRLKALVGGRWAVPSAMAEVVRGRTRSFVDRR